MKQKYHSKPNPSRFKKKSWSTALRENIAYKHLHHISPMETAAKSVSLQSTQVGELFWKKHIDSSTLMCALCQMQEWSRPCINILQCAFFLKKHRGSQFRCCFVKAEHLLSPITSRLSALISNSLKSDSQMSSSCRQPLSTGRSCPPGNLEATGQLL